MFILYQIAVRMSIVFLTIVADGAEGVKDSMQGVNGMNGRLGADRDGIGGSIECHSILIGLAMRIDDILQAGDFHLEPMVFTRKIGYFLLGELALGNGNDIESNPLRYANWQSVMVAAAWALAPSPRMKANARAVRELASESEKGMPLSVIRYVERLIAFGFHFLFVSLPALYIFFCKCFVVSRPRERLGERRYRLDVRASVAIEAVIDVVAACVELDIGMDFDLAGELAIAVGGQGFDKILGIPQAHLSDKTEQLDVRDFVLYGHPFYFELHAVIPLLIITR